MKNSTKVILSLLSGVLLALPWLNFFPEIIIFLALIPLFLLEEYFYQNKEKYSPINFFLYAWLSFAVWNLISFWWSYQPSIYGLIAPIVLNSLFLAVVFWLVHIVKRKLGENYGYFGFIIFIIAFEYLHHNWDFAFPWLSLGSGLAKRISIIQWYEFTGVLGGSLWIVVVNLLIFNIIKELKFFRVFCSKFQVSSSKFSRAINNKSRSWKKIIYLKLKTLCETCNLQPVTCYKQQAISPQKLITLAIILVIPITISLLIFRNYEEKGKQVNIAVVQPNIDPYTQKYELTANEQIKIMIKLADSLENKDIDLYIFPETAIPININEAHFDTTKYFTPIKDFINKNQKSEILIGAYTFKEFSLNNTINIPKSATKIENSNNFIDYYNTALFFNDEDKIQIYHKSKLLMGVEKMPFQTVFQFVKNIKINIAGGVTWYGTQKEPSIFISENEKIRVAPIICWESVFGEYNSQFVQKGANIIAVITNDGWWGNTIAHKRHLQFSQIRAIENRRSVARSANTGISCFINQKGQILQKTKYNERIAITDKLFINEKITFYTENGDIIGKISAFLSVLVLLMFFVRSKMKKV